MSEIVRAEVRLPYITGLPRDVAINVTHWLVDDDPGIEEFALIGVELVAFYNNPSGVADDPVGAFISDVVSREAGACEIRYSRPQENPSPIEGVETFTLVEAAETASLPLEVALCTSLLATPAFPVPL